MFTNRRLLELVVLDLNKTVRDMFGMVERVLGESVELVADLADDLEGIDTDPGRIEQIIMNLAAYAREAMPNGGSLTIRTSNVDVDEAAAGPKQPQIQPGRYVLLSMSDSGAGIDAETPSAASPAIGRVDIGPGSGLSTVYELVTQSGGVILVSSVFGQGTTFSLYLPSVPLSSR
jgi:signal transduction histidine kinase